MYPNKEKYIFKQISTFFLKCKAKGRIPYWFVWIFTVLLIISSGITYRSLASFVVNTEIKLPVPLSEFPKEINGWIGSELSIPTTTKEYMEKNFADEFVSRHYVNNNQKIWVNLYIVYCSSRPGGMLGHQPRVCYPGNGWIHENTEQSQFTTKQGTNINCLIHRFNKPAPSYDEIIILNFYLVNGRLSTNQSGVSGFSGRKFNLARNPARYIAQVQISSIMENSIRIAAEDMADLILDFLPDEYGDVAAIEKYGNY